MGRLTSQREEAQMLLRFFCCHRRNTRSACTGMGRAMLFGILPRPMQRWRTWDLDKTEARTEGGLVGLGDTARAAHARS